MERNQTRKPRRKAEYQKVVRINISLLPALDERKEELMRKFSFNDFSGYVAARMKKDLGIELPA